MKLSLIKHLVTFIEENDSDYLHETMETLEYIAESPAIKDEDIEVIGELLSNLSGAIEVKQAIDNDGIDKKTALNQFMSRVTSSIDRS